MLVWTVAGNLAHTRIRSQTVSVQSGTEITEEVGTMLIQR
jgi:hypothetical protein